MITKFGAWTLYSNGEILLSPLGQVAARPNAFSYLCSMTHLEIRGPAFTQSSFTPLTRSPTTNSTVCASYCAARRKITFRRYTGDTKWNEEDAPEEQRRAALRPNERFSRNQIRSDPPHVLLTNFAMLEYLLLRPQDSDTFRQQRLRYVILDEAHTYSGAQGIDVSLLMRRPP